MQLSEFIEYLQFNIPVNIIPSFYAILTLSSLLLSLSLSLSLLQFLEGSFLTNSCDEIQLLFPHAFPRWFPRIFGRCSVVFCFVFSHLLSMIPFKLSNLPLLLWLFLFCGRLLLSLLPSSFCFFLSTLQSHSSYLSSSSLPFSFFLLYLHCCFSFFFYSFLP